MPSNRPIKWSSISCRLTKWPSLFCRLTKWQCLPCRLTKRPFLHILRKWPSQQCPSFWLPICPCPMPLLVSPPSLTATLSPSACRQCLFQLWSFPLWTTFLQKSKGLELAVAPDTWMCLLLGWWILRVGWAEKVYLEGTENPGLSTDLPLEDTSIEAWLFLLSVKKWRLRSHRKTL